MVEIKGIVFDVDITHKRIRNLYLRLEGKTIMASAPLFMPDYEVYKFIEEKRNWIYKTYDQMTYKERTTHMYHGGDTFYIFSTPFKLIKNIGKKSVNVRENCIYLSYPDDSDDSLKYLYKYMDRILLSKANDFLDKHIGFLEDYGYMQKPSLKCRIMSSKWGVCYTRNNRITISSYLIHYPFECLEYIIVHELTHFIIPNHSRRFYDIVENNMPEYKRASDLLKK